MDSTGENRRLLAGVTIELDGREYVIPPLNMRMVRELRPQFDTFATMAKNQALPDDKQLAAIVKIVHAAMSRNYPELKPKDVEEILDLANLQSVVLAIIGSSGLVESKTAALGRSTGMESTQGSSPSLDGLGNT